MQGRVLTIPNVLSVIRLALVPVFLYLLLARHHYGPAVAILMFSGVSDWADGKIARLVANQSSRLGELLDPLVDRIYMVAVPVGLALAGAVPWWLVAVLLGRDALLAALLLCGLRKGSVGRSSQTLNPTNHHQKPPTINTNTNNRSRAPRTRSARASPPTSPPAASTARAPTSSPTGSLTRARATQ